MDAAQPGTRFRVRHVTETGSTNSDVAAAAAAGEPEGLVIVADHQTAGRGRLGRRWVAPPGSALLVSILLRPPAMAVHLGVAAVACAATSAAGVGSIKWPNDVIADDGRKLAGVLAEASLGNGTWVVVGIGFNLRQSPDMPPEVQAIATSLADWRSDPPSRDVFLADLLLALESRYASLCAAGPAALLAEYRQRCVTIGQEVHISPADGTSFDAVATGVDDACALVVRRADGAVETVTVGDVVHLRPV